MSPSDQAAAATSGAPSSPDGEQLTVTLGPVAHGGHFVARHEGRVIFVRHGLPSERVKIRLTDAEPDAKFWRADVVDVLEPAADRVEHPWPEADAATAAVAGTVPVGGAEFGHISLPQQRRLKGEVLAEQLQRLAGVELSTAVEPVEPPGSGEGLGWRTRVAFAVDPQTGRLGMHAHRSTQIIPVQQMPLALAGINDLRLWDVDYTGIERVEVAAPANGSRPLVLLIPRQPATAGTVDAVLKQLPAPVSVAQWEPDGGVGDGSGRLTRLRGRAWVAETAAGHEYRVTGDGFWQVHRRAPEVLIDALLSGLNPRSGENVADLYAGAGLFTAPLAAAVGEQGRVLSVEGAAGTSRDARRNLHAYPNVDILQGRVERILRSQRSRWNGIVLDPPRTGAGKAVVQELIRSEPRAVGYVSCDPASFARDVGYFRRSGWKMQNLRAFDLYPNTHHMETVAVLVPGSK
ncbi:MAG TPA: TRAM domain-containing protein [Arthrobacter sp.]|nr:TRAM domain-containing protein [Arthrobacter sp.]